MIPKDSSGFSVKVKPGKRKTVVLSFAVAKNEAVISVNAPADKGQANDELIRFLSHYFKKPVQILVGKTSSKKIIRVLENS